MNYLTTTNQRNMYGKRRTKRHILGIVLLCALFIACALYIVSLNNQLLEANEKIKTQEIAIEVQEETINTLNSDMDNITANSKKIIKQNKELLKKVEMYEEYDYALIDSVGERTDITTEQLELGVEKMTAAGIDPNMLFSIIMIESGGDESAENCSSTAKGYCQLIDSTAESMYKKLGYGSNYNHSTMALDGDLNIEMGSELIISLMKTYNGNVLKVLNSYSGYLTSDYKNKFINYLSKSGTTIAEIESEYAETSA